MEFIAATDGCKITYKKRTKPLRKGAVLLCENSDWTQDKNGAENSGKTEVAPWRVLGIDQRCHIFLWTVLIYMTLSVKGKTFDALFETAYVLLYT